MQLWSGLQPPGWAIGLSGRMQECRNAAPLIDPRSYRKDWSMTSNRIWIPFSRQWGLTKGRCIHVGFNHDSMGWLAFVQLPWEFQSRKLIRDLSVASCQPVTTNHSPLQEAINRARIINRSGSSLPLHAFLPLYCWELVMCRAWPVDLHRRPASATVSLLLHLVDGTGGRTLGFHRMENRSPTAK
ncbi:hypothetical protein BDW62DRAFT_177773 [Aspergillus aurantiobrunneus]